MKRRSFIKHTAVSGVVYSVAGCKKTVTSSDKTHVMSLSWDDGFKKSFTKVAEIHEQYGSKACLNVIATGHLSTFRAIDQWILPELMGDFDLWNDLVARGHEVMPHTWEHKNLTKISVAEAKERIDMCLEYFADNLDGYDPDKAVYNYAFNASTEELDLYCLEKVRAVRTGYWVLDRHHINSFPSKGDNKPARMACWFYGPDIGDDHIDKEINAFLQSEGGWMIVNLHGLDDEGWGPVSTKYYDGLVKRLVEVPHLDLLPVGEVIDRYIG